MKARMSDKEKGNTITQIMVSMKQAALAENKPFDEGIFFDLAFMSDRELLRVSKLCGIKNVKIDGYDSKKEYRRAKELKLLEKKGIITGLQEQVKYELISPQYHFYEVQGARKMLHKKKLIERGVYYIDDFVYYRDGEYIVEDTKGVRTKEYIIKRKLMLYVHGIKIKEV